MKISINQDDSFQLEQVYLPITLVTDDKEEMSIIMRDSGFEFKYQGDWYSAKNGQVELIKKTVVMLDGALSNSNELMDVTDGSFNKIVSYELGLELKEKGYPQNDTDFYYFDNTAWDKNKPIDVMTKEDALHVEKGFCFLDFDTTIAAPSQDKANSFLAIWLENNLKK